MTQKKNPAADARAAAREVAANLPPEPDQSKSTAVASGPRPRVSGRRAHPIYLIHDGDMEVEIPAETRDFVVNDEDDPDFGNVVQEIVVDAYTAKGKLPRGTRFGSRKIGLVHEIWDKAEEQSLKNRGFREASEAEVKRASKASLTESNTDYIAAKERERAQERLRRTTPRGARRTEE